MIRHRPERADQYAGDDEGRRKKDPTPQSSELNRCTRHARLQFVAIPLYPRFKAWVA